jgi:hypothetical protein
MHYFRTRCRSYAAELTLPTWCANPVPRPKHHGSLEDAARPTWHEKRGACSTGIARYVV